MYGLFNCDYKVGITLYFYGNKLIIANINKKIGFFTIIGPIIVLKKKLIIDNKKNLQAFAGDFFYST